MAEPNSNNSNPTSGKRPVRYVPSKQRRKQQQRFHGAFTGGFSAGFFNTVGSKEGWKPKTSIEEEEEEDSAPTTLHTTTTASIYGQGNQETNNAPNTNNNNNNNKRQRPQQTLEDFMDDQDHEEWGGPTTIRKEFRGGRANAASAAAATTIATPTASDNPDTAIEEWMKISIEPPSNVGLRLLRVLGWRDGRSTAYVPDDKPQQPQSSQQQLEEDSTTTNINAKVILSSKKLRKVQLQQKRVQIPPPKLDSCGLGYEPYQNAPEFKAYQEKRKKLAQQRAKLGHSSGSANVYRVSNVILGGDIAMDEDNGGGGGGDSKQKIQTNHNRKDDVGADEVDDVYVSYETVEDFVGHKSVGGFALRDDEDDAFDDGPTTLTKASEKVRLDTEEYNQVVYEHSSSDEDDNHHQSHQRSIPSSSKRPSATSSSRQREQPPKSTSNNDDDLVGVLSNFADTSGTSTATGKPSSSGAVTADGRKPLSGFVLGGSSHNSMQRYRGPDVPLSYQVKRHEFTQEEHPLVLQALSRAVQLEAADEKRRKAMDEALKANASSNAPSNRLNQLVSSVPPVPQERSSAPMAGTAFVGLAQAMKSRFTSTTEGGTKPEGQGGLRLPSKSDKHESVNNNNDKAQEEEMSTNNEIKITRTRFPFTPHRLLCKRFLVPAPMGSSSASAEGDTRETEATYFHREILSTASAPNQGEKAKEKRDGKATAASSMFEEDGTLKTIEETVGTTAEEERPSMKVYRSIYEPQSADENDDTETESDEEVSQDKSSREEQNGGPQAEVKPVGESASAVAAAESNDKVRTGSSVKEDENSSNGENMVAMVPYNDRERKKKRKKHSKRRKRSRSHDRKSRREAGDDEIEENEDDGKGKGRKSHRNRRSRSEETPSDHSTDLSRNSYSSQERRKKKRRRERKDKKHRKDKKKKKSSAKDE